METGCAKCGKPMPLERLELGYPNCKDCTPQNKPLGIVIYEHKTGGVLETVETVETFKAIKTGADKRVEAL